MIDNPLLDNIWWSYYGRTAPLAVFPKILDQFPATFYQRSPLKETVLFLAFYYQRLDVMKLCIARGCDPKVGHGGSDGMTILHALVKKFDWFPFKSRSLYYEVIKMIIDRGLSKDTKTVEGMTVLSLSSNQLLTNFLLSYEAPQTTADSEVHAH